ncbi:hypothetical protein KAU37_03005 [Candidatus Bipolaricaulota bacterium]|nr:hypothetical protein [Candidatus Bipolaricaulota bacterium]
MDSPVLAELSMSSQDCKLLREVFNSISAGVLFREFPELQDQLWRDWYFVRTVGDDATAEIIRNCTQYHQERVRDSRAIGILLVLGHGFAF